MLILFKNLKSLNSCCHIIFRASRLRLALEKKLNVTPILCLGNFASYLQGNGASNCINHATILLNLINEAFDNRLLMKRIDLK